jgi:hypothetical protein
MEPQSVFSEVTRLSAAVTFASGYASALADQRNRADTPQSEKFEEHFRGLIGHCQEAREYLPKLPELLIDKPVESIPLILSLITLMVEAMGVFISARSSSLEKNPEAKNFWTEEAQEILEETFDLLEDIQETLALGLSYAFHDEIDSARREADIDSNAEATLPTR